MNKLDKDYQALLQDILDNGTQKGDRTGTGTISVFGRQIHHNMKDGFPLLTTKKMYFKGIVTELLWFLRGETNIKSLVDNDCHIWDGDVYKNYLKNFTPPICPPNLDVQPDYYEPMSKEMFIYGIKNNSEFAEKWGELGPIYGKQWREWTYLTREQKRDIDGIDEEICGADMWDGIRHYRTFDQIANLFNDLKTNPDSRRLMVNAWNVGELDQMTLPPCHYGFQVYTRELSTVERMEYYGKHFMKETESKTFDELLKVNYDELNIPTRAISLMWNQRSCDFPLGIPYNIASYAILLEIIGKMVNMVPDELIGNLGDCHIYLNQIDGCKEQITREPYELPKLVISNQVNFGEGIDEFLNSCLITDFQIEGYQSHPTIKFPLSN